MLLCVQWVVRNPKHQDAVGYDVQAAIRNMTQEEPQKNSLFASLEASDRATAMADGSGKSAPAAPGGALGASDAPRHAGRAPDAPAGLPGAARPVFGAPRRATSAALASALEGIPLSAEETPDRLPPDALLPEHADALAEHGFRVTLDTLAGPVALVPSYSVPPSDEFEISFADARALVVIASVFPGARISTLKRGEK